jgi:hypothetical protein
MVCQHVGWLQLCIAAVFVGLIFVAPGQSADRPLQHEVRRGRSIDTRQASARHRTEMPPSSVSSGSRSRLVRGR